MSRVFLPRLLLLVSGQPETHAEGTPQHFTVLLASSDHLYWSVDVHADV
jgi:hypothetical protein